MKTIKDIIVTGVSVIVVGAAYMIGAGIGQTLWENGLEDKVEEKARKWFSK